MEDKFDRVQKRPRETRQAAYYDTTMFRSFSDLADHLGSDEFKSIQEKFRNRGWTALLYPK
jgi:hypothetical protein